MKILPAAGLALCLSAQTLPAASTVPDEGARDSIEGLLTMLNDARLRADSTMRREKIRALIHKRFDFTEMAKRSLGPEWRRRSPEEQKEFVTLFTELLERAYLASTENVEKAEFVREYGDEHYTEIKTEVVDRKGVESSLDYRLHNLTADKEWKAYDVIVDGMSLVNNSRIRFNRVLAKYSYAELVRRIYERLNARDEIQASHP